MGSKWRKVKLALGINSSCLYVPQTLDDSSPPMASAARLSDAVSPSTGHGSGLRRTTQTPSSSGGRVSITGPTSSKRTCAICLTNMKPGQGHAIFTAECSHSFHFHCITSNVKHGNQICPICRAKWKEIPFQTPAYDLSHGRSRINPVSRPQDDGWMTVRRRLLPPRLGTNGETSTIFQTPEPDVFDDDEVLDLQTEITEKRTSANEAADNNAIGIIDIKTYPEVSAVPRSASHNDFTVLIHLKAPITSERQDRNRNQTELLPVCQNSRAPVDLVTVLDVSGSMAGTKLALLKRAMGFVIENLGPSDRLSIIAFSSRACRLFPLRQMTDRGRRQALQDVNALISNGGTNIAEGLRKGAKVLVDRKWKNPVGSIILLSDGQDTYTVSNNGARAQTDYQSLLPLSICHNNGEGLQIPVHAFGFGADHDAASMHSISEISGGTFSFIEAEGVIQDAFAQCIGGLLSVVVQELQIRVECVHLSLQLSSIKAGGYQTSIVADGRMGFIDVGVLYAEEERNFLVAVNVPVCSSDEMSLLNVRCIYRDPITKAMVSLEEMNEVKIQRPEITSELVVSMKVDREQNRLRAAEAMAEARVAAENGDLAGAVSVLESCHRLLTETASARASDRLTISLCAELKEIQERMANRRVYEASGRAYILSGLSSHSWQRATARGDSTDGTSLVQAYQTPSMADMVSRSQTMFIGNSAPH
ncbi:hypothetical protein F2P56_011218 [Juglans regia]|uniref:E3 ubiquitin-protein ligase WAV3-like isoform X1 n=2 Tax=Juglans regia TaxID=51240 RepID=A0A2I4E3T4_JUGRE|nr:E3 ubiquitin-protein ligase WAV3-like isoform X1 [Juglans regia]KAF5470721.1 hypothetical protein F2P56_011218 [Juglans regia]